MKTLVRLFCILSIVFVAIVIPSKGSFQSKTISADNCIEKDVLMSYYVTIMKNKNLS